MAVRIEQLVYSATGLKAAAFIARVTPPKLGYAVCRSAARWIAARRDSELVRAVRCNQWVIGGEDPSPQYLDRGVQVVFRNSADSVYELYHYVRDAAALEQMYRIEDSFQPVVERPEFDSRGLVIAGLHLAGFDLGLRWLCKYKFKPLVFTIANPEGGRQLELEARRQMSMNVVAASFIALRRAVRHLQQGGMVLTGIDHPVPGGECQPCFFGRPGALPVEHVYMALKANVPVVVAASRLETDGKYRIHASQPIEMDRYPNKTDELRINAEKVLAVVETFIREAPQQWLIFQPVWPGIINNAPT